jgi:hypothetical protein
MFKFWKTAGIVAALLATLSVSGDVSAAKKAKATADEKILSGLNSISKEGKEYYFNAESPEGILVTLMQSGTGYDTYATSADSENSFKNAYNQMLTGMKVNEPNTAQVGFSYDYSKFVAQYTKVGSKVYGNNEVSYSGGDYRTLSTDKYMKNFAGSQKLSSFKFDKKAHTITIEQFVTIKGEYRVIEQAKNDPQVMAYLGDKKDSAQINSLAVFHTFKVSYTVKSDKYFKSTKSLKNVFNKRFSHVYDNIQINSVESVDQHYAMNWSDASDKYSTSSKTRNAVIPVN